MSNCKITATKEFVWDMAHMLSGHSGLCKNLHGHTYKMEVTASRNNEDVIFDGPSAGMVLDFKDLKDVVNRLIVEPLDHATMININSTDRCEKEILHVLEYFGKKVAKVTYRPTAENMVRDFAEQICQVLEDLDQGKLVLEKVRLYETPTSYAEWIRED